MFCSNCGSPLAEGAKFCSECGTKVEETKVRDFGTLNFDESAHATDVFAGDPVREEEAFESRVSFDWSNVIDEPQRKEIPQGIKSPWAATTDSIDERQLYSEMTQSDDRNRTMSFIDVLKADKEERERAALDKSIEYTEVLEIDPEVVGGTKPPKLRMAPLYEDVDEPVKTPFDDVETSPEPEQTVDPFDKKDTEPSGKSEAAHIEETPSAAPKFELPDFLKKAVGFGVGKDEVVEIGKETEDSVHKENPAPEELKAEESAAEEAVVEELVKESIAEEAVAEEIAKESIAEEAVAEEIAKESIAEEAVAEEIVKESIADEAAAEELVNESIAEEVIAEAPQIEELVAEDIHEEDAEDAYLDEDLYLELSEEPRSDRISRIVAHAAEYEAEDEDDTPESEADAPVDETELFSEMTNHDQKRTGMTIAAPADEEAEIEALKRRLAELTGTVEIAPELLAGAEAEQKTEPAAELVEESVVAPVETFAEEAVVAPVETLAEEAEIVAPDEETEEAEAGSFEALGADFAFEPETTEVDNEVFKGLSAGLETFEEPAPEPVVEPEYDDFKFEPEVTEADDRMFADLTAARESAFRTAVVEPISEAAVEAPVIEPISEAAVEAPVIEPISEAAVEAPVIEPISEVAFEAPVIEPLDEAASKPSFGLSADDELTVKKPETAGEISAVEAAFGLPVNAEAETAKPVEEEKPDEKEPTVEDLLAKYVPQYFGEKARETAAEETVIAEPVDDASPIVGFAPAVTEPPKTATEVNAPSTGRGTISLEDFMTDTEEPAKPVETEQFKPVESEPVKPVEAEPVKPVETTAAVVEPKTTDAVSLEDLEKDIFGTPAGGDADAETTKKIDKFYTLYRKNEEFQRLLDEEYSRLKGENIVIPEDDVPGSEPGVRAAGAAVASEGTAQVTEEAVRPAAAFDAGATLEDLTADSRPVEDATIYRVGPSEELGKLNDKTVDNQGFSVGGEEVKSFGLDGAEASDSPSAAAGTSATVAAGVAAAGAAGTAALTKAEKKAAKKAEKKRKKEEAAAAQVEYEEVDGGSTILTVLAVIVAVLLVVLLAIILILHVAPDSGIAMAIDEFIENMTSRFSALNTFGGQRLL